LAGSGYRRVALYTGLHPGRYWFRVEACNDHGYWSEKPAELRFQIAPFFYETRPFYILCAIAVGGLLVAWHLSRLSTLRRVQQLEQAQLLYNERSRIAKDLHDDLGANLTGIALQLELSRREIPSPPVRQQLENAIGSIRSLIDGMREVVWSLDPECDSLESFCAYVCQRAEEFLEAAGLRHRFDMPQSIPAMTLTAENRHHLLLIVREALNNVVKHAQATEVHLRLAIDERSLDLVITDNGIGFTPPPEPENGGSGCGLLNMLQRVEALGGAFAIASAPDQGTRITCAFPLPLASSSRTLPSHADIHSSSAG
jgi:signal transduction histidine kinase